jgi:hypothetical protein
MGTCQYGSIKKLGLLLGFALCLKAQLPVPLGTAGSFAVLAGAGVTNTGNTVVNGNLGTSPTLAVVGFPPGIVINGSIYTGAGSLAGTAQGDLTAAYNNAAGRACPGPVLLGGADIGGRTFLPGVYCDSSSVGITGTVTLNGNGNPNAVFIFQIGSTLITAANNSNVNLIGGAQAANVFWQVGSSATLGTSTTFNGTILALHAITVNTGAVLNGRALARTDSVTLQGNAVTLPATPPPGGGAGPLSVTCSYPSGQVGVAYSSFLVATGGRPAYSYSIAGGSLPTGLTLNPSTGAITGTPTAAGTFSDTSRVADSAGGLSTSACGITIGPAAGGALSLTCAANIGQVGQPYVSAMVATGGTAPYTYSISAGSLPPGLTLDPSTGAISGTPTTAGSFSYTGRVADSAAGSATTSCGALTITSAPPPGVPAPPSLILVMAGLAIATLYLKREQLLARFRRT